MTNSNLTFGITLSGGGARGIAHVGVLKALEEHEIFPNCVSGTSMGAIVGVLYAAGFKPCEIEEIFHNEKIYRSFKVEWFSRGFLSLARVKDILAKYIEVDDFESLKKPFSLGVSNLNTGRGEVINKGGNLKDWVVASASIPVIFSPVNINGNYYVDGGLFQNLPSEALVGQCNYIIGSSVNPITREFKVESTKQVAERVFNLAIAQNVYQSRIYCDFFIEPRHIRQYTTWDYSKLDELIEEGYMAAKRVINNMIIPELSLNESNEEPEIQKTTTATKTKMATKVAKVAKAVKLKGTKVLVESKELGNKS